MLLDPRRLYGDSLSLALGSSALLLLLQVFRQTIVKAFYADSLQQQQQDQQELQQEDQQEKQKQSNSSSSSSRSLTALDGVLRCVPLVLQHFAAAAATRRDPRLRSVGFWALAAQAVCTLCEDAAAAAAAVAAAAAGGGKSLLSPDTVEQLWGAVAWALLQLATDDNALVQQQQQQQQKLLQQQQELQKRQQQVQQLLHKHQQLNAVQSKQIAAHVHTMQKII